MGTVRENKMTVKITFERSLQFLVLLAGFFLFQEKKQSSWDNKKKSHISNHCPLGWVTKKESLLMQGKMLRRVDEQKGICFQWKDRVGWGKERRKKTTFGGQNTVVHTLWLMFWNPPNPLAFLLEQATED